MLAVPSEGGHSELLFVSIVSLKSVPYQLIFGILYIANTLSEFKGKIVDIYFQRILDFSVLFFCFLSPAPHLPA